MGRLTPWSLCSFIHENKKLYRLFLACDDSIGWRWFRVNKIQPAVEANDDANEANHKTNESKGESFDGRVMVLQDYVEVSDNSSTK